MFWAENSWENMCFEKNQAWNIHLTMLKCFCSKHLFWISLMTSIDLRVRPHPLPRRGQPLLLLRPSLRPHRASLPLWDSSEKIISTRGLSDLDLELDKIILSLIKILLIFLVSPAQCNDAVHIFAAKINKTQQLWISENIREYWTPRTRSGEQEEALS